MTDITKTETTITWHDLPDDSSEALIDYLDDVARERVAEMTAEGCSSGELNAFFIEPDADDDSETGYRGWWSVQQLAE